MAVDFIKGLQTLCKEGSSLCETILIVDNLIVHGLNPWFSATILYHLVQRCIDRKDLDAARLLHSIVMKRAHPLDSFLGSHLIRMYALCDRLSEANDVFYKVFNPNAFAWTALILAHSRLGSSRYVIHLFRQLQLSDVTPGEYIYISVLKACSRMECLHEGMLIHTHLVESEFNSNVTVCNMLISMYCACGCLCDACKVFEKMHKVSVVTWNAMITGYSIHNCDLKALQLYYQMCHDDRIRPDNVTIVTTLKACSHISALDCGQEIYANLIEDDFSMDVSIVNALLDMFTKSGGMQDAIWLFHNAKHEDAITWSVMIAGYVQNGCIEAGMELFNGMLQEGVEPDSVTFASMVQASSILEDISQGRVLHAFIASDGDDQEDVFVGSALINMYSKTGNLDDARTVFKSLKMLNNVVTWSALITGYSQHGHQKEVVKLFMQMQEQHITPNSTTFICVLTACADARFIEEGRAVHSYVIDGNHELDASASSALVDMYVKCGRLEDAKAMLERSPERSISTWTTLIAGYARHNDYLSALALLNEMQKEGLKPNTITYISLIAACSHVGLIDDGCHYFNSVREEELSILPTHEHYNCMIDLFGRVGLLDEADVIQKTLPFKPDFAGWVSLLSHCKVHGDGDLASQCFHSAMHA
mgnify:CR=1 FL=1